MTELEWLQEQLRETAEIISATRLAARDNPGSQGHSLTLRSLEKRQRTLQERISRVTAAG